MPKPQSHDDFASAAMMRMIAAGVDLLGLGPREHPPMGAHVPRPQKRAVLQALLDLHGPVAVLALSDGLDVMRPEPVLQALQKARSVGELLDRWGRLERFSHARHTVLVKSDADGAFRLSHTAKDSGPAPSLAETLLVFGTVTKLTEMIGAKNVLLQAENGSPFRQNRAWKNPKGLGRLNRVVLSTDETPAKPKFDEPDIPQDPVAAVRARIKADPIRRWSIEDLARDTAMSTRTLQRRLSEKSVSFSRIMSKIRMEIAADYLCAPESQSLAEIGFLTGFSDQAHFSREFRRNVGTSPRAFREEFQ
ncbi:MAG: helix-turn-helix transcriptional regulator [Rhodobacteraceae bacterium]|nr:helix-turn-helix transcriptional regulator [Paracoccaceae bacterium]